MTKQKIIITTSEEITDLKKEFSDFKEFMTNYSEKILKPKLLPPHEAAKYFYVSEATLREHSGNDTYKQHKLSDRKIYYNIEEIENHILGNVVENK